MAMNTSSLRLWCAAGVFLFLLVDSTLSYSFYGTKIPNGRNVLHPCTSNIEWLGVGHFLHTGGGPRNQFGLDFSEAGHTWTRELCEKDSDNDGRSNGEELGDPDCVWKEGDTPTSFNTSHPGICEPVDSPTCRSQSSFNCDGSIGFECPAINEPDVDSFDIRLPISDVPNEETTYICRNLMVPVTKPSHIIAYEPIVDNVNVLHHTVMYGCLEPPQMSEEVYSCGMAPPECRSMLIVWSFGIDGGCFNEITGIAIGPGAYEYLVINVHWNNPQLVDGYTDSSGLKLYYTENLREFTSQTMTIGQLFLNIPPMQDRVVQTTVCKSQCVGGLSEPVYISNALVHMHYLGAGGRIELYRDGELHDYIVNDDTYSYESPLVHEFDPPKEVLPGDEIRVHCYFNSLDGPNRRETPTFFGQATKDEMCFAFMMYYPGPSTPTNSFMCLQMGEIDACPAIVKSECDDCYAYKFLIELSEYLEASQACSTSCSPECLEQIRPSGTIPCIPGALTNLNNLCKIPLEFQPAINAMRICGRLPMPNKQAKGHPAGYGMSRMFNSLERKSAEAARTCVNEYPPFDTCGLNIQDGGQHVTYSYMTVLAAAMLAWLHL